MVNKISYRNNYLRNASLLGHEWIPQHVCISEAYCQEAGSDLERICGRYQEYFPELKNLRRPDTKRNRRHVDEWGCEWDYELDGLEGIVVGHPLADWSNMDKWTPPQPPQPPEQLAEIIANRRMADQLVTRGTPHGFLFLRLSYLRGLDNLLIDMAGNDPRLDQLIEIIVQYWEKILAPYAAIGIDVLQPADDLGAQTASIMGPKHFGRWLLPAYKRLYTPFRKGGAHVHMHHDGYIMDIVHLIMESGVTIINPQDLVNGIDNLAREVKGRVCIDLDIDRQSVIPYGSPADVRDLIKEEVLKLGSPAGGLEMTVGIYPPTPIENVDALCSAMAEYRTYWVGR
jgi:uroporphyrinogen decarboxylase